MAHAMSTISTRSARVASLLHSRLGSGSASNTTDDKICALEAALAKSEASNVALKIENIRLRKLVNFSVAEVVTPRATTSPPPSYQQATQASSSRQVQIKSPAQVERSSMSSCKALNVDVNQGKVPSFLRHTTISARKAGLFISNKLFTSAVPLVTQQGAGLEPLEDKTDTSTDWWSTSGDEWTWTAKDDTTQAVNTVDSFDDLDIEQPQPTARTETCEWCVKHALQKPDLIKESGRYDDSFYATEAGKCYAPFKTALRCMRAAHRLAQEAMWCDLRVHNPSFQRRHYLEGPCLVRFGVTELKDAFGGGRSYCGHSPLPKSALDTVDLRNAICHPSYRHNSHEMDTFMGHAQELAIVVGDAPRAHKIRAVRNALQAACQKAYDEITAYNSWTARPIDGVKRWGLHQQLLFAKVKNEESWVTSAVFAAPVVRAARTWKLDYRRPDEENKTFKLRVSKAKEAESPKTAFPNAVTRRVVSIAGSQPRGRREIGTEGFVLPKGSKDAEFGIPKMSADRVFG